MVSFVSKDESPCYGCVKPVRHPGCHGSCAKFKDYQELLNKRKAEYFKSNLPIHRVTVQDYANALKRFRKKSSTYTKEH